MGAFTDCGYLDYHCGASKVKRYVVLSDIQIPFQDDSALEVAYKLIKDIKPDGVILNGDITDCYAISDFDKEIGRAHV